MMKILFWILLLGNVVLFTVMQWGGFFRSDQGGQAQADLNSEMIRLMPSLQSALPKPVLAPVAVAPAPVRVPVATTMVPVSAPIAVSTTLSSTTLSHNMDAETATKPDTPICLEWGDFSGEELTRANSALSALQLVDKVSQQKVDRDMGYWVYFAPFKNKAGVKKKITELKELGINEYYVIQTPGHLLNAISLGVFKTREAAQNFLDHLRTKGVRTAKIGERASKLKATVFLLNKVDATIEARLAVIQKDFAGTELKKVPCTHVDDTH
jgi:cell division septation protein DedD